MVNATAVTETSKMPASNLMTLSRARISPTSKVRRTPQTTPRRFRPSKAVPFGRTRRASCPKGPSLPTAAVTKAAKVSSSSQEAPSMLRTFNQRCRRGVVNQTREDRRVGREDAQSSCIRPWRRTCRRTSGHPMTQRQHDPIENGPSAEGLAKSRPSCQWGYLLQYCPALGESSKCR